RGGGLERGEEPSGNKDGACGGALGGEERTAGEGHLVLRSESRNPGHMLPSHTVPPTRCLRRETERAPARSDPEGTRARRAMQPDPGHGNPDTPAGLLPHDSPSLQATQRIGWQTCRKLTRFQQLAARLRALLSADTDQALVRARTDGEKLVGILRLAFIVIF